MTGNPMNVPPVSISAAKAALIEQYRDPSLRRRATMLWGTRGVGKSSVVRQVAEHFAVPLLDLRLTTIEPVDLRGAIYADDRAGRTVWFPPEFLPTADQPAGILFLDELTAADQRLQISAYSLILDRRVGNYQLPDGWQVIAAGNASFHGAITHDMGTALADRMFHFHVQTAIEAFLAHALAHDFAPEVMAYLKVRPDRLPWEPGLSGVRPVPRLAVIVDLSGSVGDQLLARFCAEVSAIARRTEAGLVLVLGDDQVRRVERLDPSGARQRGALLDQLLRRGGAPGGGGTDFTPLLREADRHHPDVGVVLTDLQGPARHRPAWPVLWAVPEEQREARAPFGRLLVLR